MSAESDDPRELDLPPRWPAWQQHAKLEYLTVNLSRADLFRTIVLETRTDVEPADVDATSRFTKADLARIALRLGVFR